MSTLQNLYTFLGLARIVCNDFLLSNRVAVAKLREPVLSNEEASSRFWIVDKDGLITKARSVDVCIAIYHADVKKP